MCSLATKPLKLSCTISESLVLTELVATLIPVPAPTSSVAEVVPPPVRPSPATTLVISAELVFAIVNVPAASS